MLSGGPQMEMKVGEKTHKYFELARERRKAWNMMLMMILIVVPVLGKFS